MRLEVEVKAPRKLWDPDPSMTEDQVRRMVDEKLRKAIGGSRPQVAKTVTGLLALTAFFANPPIFHWIQHSVEGLLGDAGGRTNLWGVLMMNLETTPPRTQDLSDGTSYHFGMGDPSVTIPNPWYAGPRVSPDNFHCGPPAP